MRSELGSMAKLEDGRWRVRVTVGYDPETGAQIRKSKTVRGSKKQARLVLNELIERYGGRAGGATTFRSFVENMYYPWHDQKYRRRDSTHKLHALLDSICEGEIGGMPMLDIDRAYMSRWVLAHRSWESNRVRAVLNKAEQWDVISKNPMAGLEIDAPAPQRRRLTREQLLDVLEAVRGTAIEPGVVMQASCGLRVSEALALDYEDIDFDAGTVEIRRTFHYDKGGSGWFEDTKNRNSRGRLTVPAWALDRLAQIAVGMPGGAHGPLMISPRLGTRMIPNTYTSMWRRLARPVLGDAYVPVENLRHTHGSLLFDAGESVEHIRMRLRHSSTKITERYYLRPDETAERSCAATFDDIMGPGQGRDSQPPAGARR